MATTSTPVHDPGATAQLRHIPLSRIVVADGFNPRGEVLEDRELEQLAESMRQHGCLQPVRVRATEDGDYALIAGERRYRAAAKAALMEIPAIVRPAGADDDDEQTDLLIEAVIENDLRVDLDVLARARGYRRLIDSGLTVKGVAQRLATTQARVREHLRILKLPEDAQAKLAAGDVPLRAVKALEGLAAIAPGPRHGSDHPGAAPDR
jgi:ParB family chromosome partitioning protein